MNEFYWPVRVYYEDTDSGGVVYHTNYLKYMERARTELLRHIGFEQDRLIEQENILFAVRAVKMDYLKPGKFNDQLEVLTCVSKLGKASITFSQSVRRPSDAQTLCDAEVRIACLRADTMLPCPIPTSILSEIKHAG